MTHPQFCVPPPALLPTLFLFFSNSTPSFLSFFSPERTKLFPLFPFLFLSLSLPSLSSSPLLSLLSPFFDLAQDDASEIVERRLARLSVPKTYCLGETNVHVVVCGREQWPPPPFIPETRPEHRHGKSLVSSC